MEPKPEIDFRPLKVVHRVPGMERVLRNRDLAYRASPTLLMDLYRPAEPNMKRLPAVIFIHGDGPPEWLRDIKDWGQYVGWGELIAASGMVAVTFNHRSTERSTRIADAASDVDGLILAVNERAADYGIDPGRLAVWVASAGGYLGAHAALKHQPDIRCLAIFYGLMEPPGESNERVGFSPTMELRKEGPAIFVARAGLDHPRLNQTLDAFAQTALKVGLDLEVHNHARGRHAFDVLDAGPRSIEIIARSVEFLKARLLTA